MSDKLKVQNNGSYSLNFDKLDKTYVIHYTGDYLNGTSEVNFRTQLTGYPENRYKTYYYNNGYTLTWDNGLVLYSNKADGDGKYGPIVDSNNFNSLKIVVMVLSADNTMPSKLLKQKKIKTIHRLTLITTQL